jgi:uncharacterized repeat protein (TIGR03943 family)
MGHPGARPAGPRRVHRGTFQRHSGQEAEDVRVAARNLAAPHDPHGFTTRVQQDRQAAINGRTVQLTGFGTPAGQVGAWYLTRIIFTCCAADSCPVKVRVYGTTAPPANTWLAVTGTWHPSGTLGTKTAAAALDVRTVRRISPPVNAYTDDLPLMPSQSCDGAYVPARTTSTSVARTKATRWPNWIS